MKAPNCFFHGLAVGEQPLQVLDDTLIIRGSPHH